MSEGDNEYTLSTEAFSISNVAPLVVLPIFHHGIPVAIFDIDTDPLVWCVKLEDNWIQNLHLGRYIVGYTVGNLVLRRRVSGAVKRDFEKYIRRYTSPKENFEYGYPHSTDTSSKVSVVRYWSFYQETEK